MGMIWFVCSLIYCWAASNSIMAPTNPLVFDSPKYSDCKLEKGGNWTTCLSPYEYTTFSPWMYSLDLILPLVDLQQDKDWSPMVQEPRFAKDKDGKFRVDINGKHIDEQKYSKHGVFVRWLMWFEILFGWVASLLFVAVLSGLAKPKNTTVDDN
jgi:hypothetical protein